MPQTAVHSAATRLEIPVRFADLRRLAREVPAHLAELVGCEDEPRTLRTAVEDDWNIAGLDTEELILAFGKKYRVDLTRFDFTGFISPDDMSPLQACLLPILGPVLLLLWLTKKALAVLCWPFSQLWASIIWRFSLTNALWPTTPRLLTQVLTTGDFVASAAAGHFVKRERVRFVLIK